MEDTFYQIVKRPQNNDEREAAMLAINVSVSRNPTYSENITGSDKREIRSYWQKLLLEFYEKHKQGNVGIKEFRSSVDTIKKDMNSRFPDKFQCNTKGYDNGFRLAHAQKSLSVFLKHLWRMGKMKEPPLCPIDGIILNDVLKKKGTWTKLNDTETYELYIGYVNDAANKSRKSVAEWEYENWNKIIEAKNRKKDNSNTHTSQQKQPSASKTNAKKSKKDDDNEWIAYQPFEKLEGNTSGMELVMPGYCLPLKNNDGVIEHYRIFVAKHKSTGLYFCKLEEKWGTDTGNIDDNPDAYSIFNEFTPKHKLYGKIKVKAKQTWYNSKNGKAEALMYRFLTFDDTVSKEDAVAFMNEIKDYVQNTLKN